MLVSLSSDTLNQQQLYDYGIYRLRQQLAPVPGHLPDARRREYRQIMVDIDPVKLEARGSPADIVNAVNAQNLTLPSGLAKIGDTQYTVRPMRCRRRSLTSTTSRLNIRTGRLSS